MLLYVLEIAVHASLVVQVPISKDPECGARYLQDGASVWAQWTSSSKVLRTDANSPQYKMVVRSKRGNMFGCIDQTLWARRDLQGRLRLKPTLNLRWRHIGSTFSPPLLVCGISCLKIETFCKSKNRDVCKSKNPRFGRKVKRVLRNVWLHHGAPWRYTRQRNQPYVFNIDTQRVHHSTLITAHHLFFKLCIPCFNVCGQSSVLFSAPSTTVAVPFTVKDMST